MDVTCPHCNRVLQIPEEMAGQSGTCRHCGEKLTVPAPPPQSAATSIDALREAPDPAPGRIEPESFGAYSKADSANWEDPSEKAAAQAAAHEEEEAVELPEVPEEILARARALKRQRMKQIAFYVAIALAVALLVSPLLLAPFIRGAEEPESTPATATEEAVDLPGADPPSAPEAP